MKSVPVFLELNVESMKHQMVHAFHTHSTEIQESIKIACDKFIKHDLDRLVQEAFNAHAKKAIDSYFSYGQGHTFIKESVEAGFEKNFKKPTKRKK